MTFDIGGPFLLVCPHMINVILSIVRVDGEYLSFAADRPGISTDYMELCDLLVLHQNATSGPYSTVSEGCITMHDVVISTPP